MKKANKQKGDFFKKLKVLKGYIVLSILSTVLVILIAAAYEIFIADKYYPKTFVGNINISFLTEGQAIRKLQDKFDQRSTQKLQFIYKQASLTNPEQVFTIDIATASANLDYSAMEQVWSNSHSGKLINQLQKQLQSLFQNSQINPNIGLNLDKQTSTLQTAVDKPFQNAELTFDETTTIESTSSSRIQIKEGLDGLTLDKERLAQRVSQFLLTGEYDSELPLKTVQPKITTAFVTKAKLALEKLINEPIKLTFDNRTWTIDTKQALALLDLQTGQDFLLDKAKTGLYLDKIAFEIDQQVQEGLFEFNPTTKRVTAFKPSQEGRKLDVEAAYQLITDALNKETKTIILPVSKVLPKIQTADVNSLGIQELLGRGISRFAGSIPNRIYNINLTASKINGVLIPPGEIFSFNQTIGDITAATGFKQAYVIKEGRTVLDDGGGVCQDSTTLFRAVLNAGLPVVKRTAHAYRVGYYEQGFPPGLDATVFYPSVDFQFKNDTSAHILIQAYTSGTTLYVDLYGASDGRTVTLTKPIILNQTPPPPDLRQDDPTLPQGTVKQVDWSAWGANVSFKRTVYKQGETILNETWRSNYKPWQAIFLVGIQ